MPVLQLSPRPAFCVKSTTQAPATLRPGPIDVPAGRKVFVNIAWDSAVPPPPDADDSTVERAVAGEHTSWYVPVIVSAPAEVPDKAGAPSLVFDAVYNTTVKSRTLRNNDFKFFLVELAFQQIERQTGLVLSRQIATPNIASKGKLLPRTVNIPGPLIQDISDVVVPPPPPDSAIRPILKSPNDASRFPLNWSWSKADNRLNLEIIVPGLTPAIVNASTLDIEPRRIILVIPHRPVLDIDLEPSDAEIASRVASTWSAASDSDDSPLFRQQETTRRLQLKRQPDFDVDSAHAEWKLGSQSLLIHL